MSIKVDCHLFAYPLKKASSTCVFRRNIRIKNFIIRLSLCFICMKRTKNVDIRLVFSFIQNLFLSLVIPLTCFLKTNVTTKKQKQSDHITHYVSSLLLFFCAYYVHSFQTIQEEHSYKNYIRKINFFAELIEANTYILITKNTINKHCSSYILSQQYTSA